MGKMNYSAVHTLLLVWSRKCELGSGNERRAWACHEVGFENNQQHNVTPY